MLKADNLTALSNVKHGFFTRRNGHSSGIYAGLNCGLGSGDHKGVVIRNRNMCAELLGVESCNLLTVHQEHTADVVTVDTPWVPDGAPVADALVTDRPGLALAILAADCAPILFADPEAGVIGAAHAGWKGAFGGIIEATVGTMTTLGAQRETIRVAVGPCIGASSYEVGPEFRTRIVEQNTDHDCYFKGSGKADHFYFDLQSYVANRIKLTGISKIESLDTNTYGDEERFFSYRRACHRGETDYGRQLSGIALIA
ncbi:MAG: peptidoglycan editing factor PgeF [Rhodospirillaceae bacterium]|jgi:polyphenol oxidase|nr:peptidoglycan editing factor PgeF [Rhodospirillaceae bacterium]